MINVLLSGCNGRMGKAIVRETHGSDLFRVNAGIDVNPDDDNYSSKNNFPVFMKLSDFVGDVDVIIDFSHHTAVEGILEFAVANKIPTVIATTGHTEEETNAIKAASKFIPIFFSRNMSIGVNLIVELAKKVASLLGEDFNIEIIEKHHNQKLDAPSGTALMIADAISEAVPYNPEYVYDRHTVRKVRQKEEIGIHSIRGGSIVGEHEVLFAGTDETITISHSASSREVFAHGALRAANYIYNKPAGFYNMGDIVKDID